MSKELGDSWSSGGGQLQRTVESDGTNLTAGDAVTMDGSQQVTPTGDGDDLYGVVTGPSDDASDLSDLSAGDEVVVCVHGPVIANVGSNVTNGDLVETSATSGQLAQNTTGTEQDVDEGGTATYTIAAQTAKAYSDANGTLDGHDLGANEAALFVL
jgi:hypothetical protein